MMNRPPRPYPEKTLALVTIGTYAKRIRDAEYPWGPTMEQREHFFEIMRKQIEPDTVLATVLVARMVGIKERVESLGPERWSEWLRRLHAHIAKEIEWFRGREIDLIENR